MSQGAKSEPRPSAPPPLVEGTLPDFRRVVRGGLGAGRTEAAGQLRVSGAGESGRGALLRLAMARGWPADSRCLYLPMAAHPTRALDAAAAVRHALPDAALAYVPAQPLRLALVEAAPQRRGGVLLFPLAVRLRCHADLLDAANQVVALAGNHAVSRYWPSAGAALAVAGWAWHTPLMFLVKPIVPLHSAASSTIRLFTHHPIDQFSLPCPPFCFPRYHARATLLQTLPVDGVFTMGIHMLLDKDSTDSPTQQMMAFCLLLRQATEWLLLRKTPGVSVAMAPGVLRFDVDEQAAAISLADPLRRDAALGLDEAGSDSRDAGIVADAGDSNYQQTFVATPASAATAAAAVSAEEDMKTVIK